MAHVAELWRHPIKAHGCEALTTVDLQAGQTVPWDRTWAVAHEASKADGSDWTHCSNFSRGAKAPKLMAVQSSFDEKTNRITLSHPDLAPITFDPDGDTDAFVAWSAQLIPDNRAASKYIVRAQKHGMTDAPFPSISILSKNSLEVLSQRVGQPLSTKRFRGNIWLEGLQPWEEFDWIDKTLRIGRAELKIIDRNTRCLATHADPETGERDADVLDALDRGWGHNDFGVYAKVTLSGRISLGDTVEIA
ncbi:MOSC domain-containing protein [Pseudaestuariivita rosea]|uniref:MOSC domain-containing protein n=1 Tax=Pseudaestuariivita rosea TaxID=2763263 RepID=UPI0030132948